MNRFDWRDYITAGFLVLTSALLQWVIWKNLTNVPMVAACGTIIATLLGGYLKLCQDDDKTPDAVPPVNNAEMRLTALETTVGHRDIALLNGAKKTVDPDTKKHGIRKV